MMDVLKEAAKGTLFGVGTLIGCTIMAAAMVALQKTTQ